VRNEEEEQFLQENTPGIPLLGVLYADLAVQEADRLGIAVFDYVPQLKQKAHEMADQLLSVVEKN